MTTPAEPGLVSGIPAAPDPAKPAPARAPAPAAPGPDPIPTGFPEAAAPDLGRAPAADGMTRLATVPPFGSLTVPPLEAGGESVVITAEGTDVDAGTAERAQEAARLAGFRLREV